MVDSISAVVSGVLSAIGTLIDPLPSGSTTAVAYTTLMALPILGGTVAFTRRLIKKSR